MTTELDMLRALRKAKREARRAKQRQNNILRAAKMHAARLRFQRTRAKLGPCSSQSRAAAPAVQYQTHIGCSGWFYWHWRERFYPRALSTSGWFEHYARHFRTVELNAPFYAWPTVSTVETWRRQCGRREFTYSVKVCELITHTRRFVGTKTLVRDFGHIADLLEARLGCFLFQLPPSFHYSSARLRRIVSSLDPERRNVVEFRHRSWWNSEVYRALRNSGTTFCSCSGPRLPDELVKTSDDIYIRFHGTKRWYRHDYTLDELKTWAQRIAACGAKRIWCYFNNDRDGYAIQNARTLRRLLSHLRR